MSRTKRRHESQLWPALTMLMAAAVLPAACVLWFMGEAMRNERLATRERLLEAYRGPLERVQGRLDVHWKARLAELTALDHDDIAPAVQFASQIARGHFDSVVLYDRAGSVCYPDVSPAIPAGNEELGPEWEAAEALEFETHDPSGAAGLYVEIAQTTTEPALAARARIAAARCVHGLRSGVEAAQSVVQVFDDPAVRTARDEDGRLIIADAGLLAVQWLEPDPSSRDTLARRLARLAADYQVPMPATQRRGLMEQLSGIVGRARFPSLAAEQLAAAHLEAEPRLPARGLLVAAPLPGIWRLAASDGTAVGLLRQERMEADFAEILRTETFSGATLRLEPPGLARATPLLTIPLSDLAPGWGVALDLIGPDPFAAHAQRRTTTYLWAGIAVVMLTLAMTMLTGRYVGRQVRLTRLKNDLIATVSHELKTPLASIRALVDTLLEVEARDPRRNREYLELIARENLRLSRLIDNFLAFSRMERNKQTLDFAPVRPAVILAAAREAFGERFHAAGCTLGVKSADDPPEIMADRDAMVTVLLNLLDNAWKYTGKNKRIGLRLYGEGPSVCFEVTDNGIGLSRRAVRRIFDRFYQVDRSLSRQAGGCGLGLSIVKFIVDAHGGKIDVFSRPGEGSRFVVRLPTLAGDVAPRQQAHSSAAAHNNGK